MGIGLSFGKKSQSANGTSTIDKDTITNGTQNTVSNQSGSTNTNTTGSTTNNQVQSGATQQTQDQKNIGQTTGKQTGITTNLSGDVQDALTGKLMEVLGGGINGDSIGALSSAIEGRAGFDVDSFVSGITGAARNRGEQTLQESNSGFASRAGGTAQTNSMAALLAQRGRNDLESNIANISAQARAQGEGIVNENLKTGVGVAGGLSDISTALAGALKGATTTTDMTSLQDEISQLIGKTGGVSSESTTGTQNTSQSTATTQLLQEIANVLTNQNVSETGTETQKTKGKSGGFGLSLGL